jgi:hypothetical protein
MKFKIALGVALIAAGSANAATSNSSFSNPLAVTEINQTGALNFFNASLGTLTGAVLTITDAMNTDVTFRNAAAQAQNFKSATTLDLILGSSLSPLNSIIANAAPATVTFAIGTTSIAANATSPVFSSGVLTPATPGSLNLSSILASLIGTGSFNITCNSFTPTSVTQVGGNITSTQNTQASCGASIAYTFTPATITPTVPVAATAALLGLGLLAAGAVRRRKA